MKYLIKKILVNKYQNLGEEDLKIKKAMPLHKQEYFRKKAEAGELELEHEQKDNDYEDKMQDEFEKHSENKKTITIENPANNADEIKIMTSFLNEINKLIKSGVKKQYAIKQAYKFSQMTPIILNKYKNTLRNG